MTNAETIADALREFSTLLAQDIKDCKTPEQQEALVEMVSIMRRMARLVATMTFSEAVITVLEFDEDERSIVLDLMAKRGLFL